MVKNERFIYEYYFLYHYDVTKSHKEVRWKNKMAEEKNPEMEKLEKTAKKVESSQKGIFNVGEAMEFTAWTSLGKKDDNGHYAGIDKEADDKKVGQKISEEAQFQFYTKVAGMSAEDYESFKRTVHLPVTAGGRVAEDVFSSVNGVPGKDAAAGLVKRMKEAGSRGFSNGLEKVLEGMLGKVDVLQLPKNHAEADAMKEFVKKYHPDAKQMKVDELYSPQEIAQAYQASISGYLSSKD